MTLSFRLLSLRLLSPRLLSPRLLSPRLRGDRSSAARSRGVRELPSHSFLTATAGSSRLFSRRTPSVPVLHLPLGPMITPSTSVRFGRPPASMLDSELRWVVAFRPPDGNTSLDGL